MTVPSRGVIADSGYMIALYDSRDKYHAAARELSLNLDHYALLVPWPALYETLSTRFAKNPRQVVAIDAALVRPNVVLFDDAPYRHTALSETARWSAKHRPIALVDHIIRLIASDDHVRVSALISFNQRDFIDICRARGIELLPTA